MSSLSLRTSAAKEREPVIEVKTIGQILSAQVTALVPATISES